MQNATTTTVIVADDNSVTLPDWVQEGLDLREGDEIEFVKVPGQDAFLLQKVGTPVDAMASQPAN